MARDLRKAKKAAAEEDRRNSLSDKDWGELLTKALRAKKALKKAADTFNANQRKETNEKVVAPVKGELGMMMGDFNELFQDWLLSEDEDNLERFVLRMQTLQRGHRVLGIAKAAEKGAKQLDLLETQAETAAREQAKKDAAKARADAKKGKSAKGGKAAKAKDGEAKEGADPFVSDGDGAAAEDRNDVHAP